MLNYTPKVYAGEHFGQIFSEILFANNTIKNNLVSVMDNVKYEMSVTTLSGSLPVQAYKTDVTSADASGSLSFSDVTVRPIKSMIYDEFTFETLRQGTRFTEGMKSGAANMESDEFLSAVLAYVEPKISRGLEESFWASIATKAAAAVPAGQKVTAAALTETNIVAELTKVYKLIPDEVLNSGEAKIFADHSIFKLVVLANQNATYRDIVAVVNGEHYFNGVKIEYVPLGAKKMLAGNPKDLFWATDLISDMGQIQVEKVRANSDLMFIKTVFTQDAAIVIPAQKVLYA